MSEYQERLDAIRSRLGNNAKSDVEELYKILTGKEKKSPKESREILEHDLGDLYARRTILQFLPDECKDEEKQKAGKTEKKGKIVIDTSGKPIDPAAGPAAPSNSQNNAVNKVKKVYPGLEEEENNDPELPENIDELKKIIISQFEQLKEKDLAFEKERKEKNQANDALRKSSFKKASDPDNINEEYDERIAIPMLVSKLRQKQNSGWHFVENRMRFIS